MSGEAFYSVEDLPPPWSVKTRVIWRTKRGISWPLVCARYQDPKTRKERWATQLDDGSIVRLPLDDKAPIIPTQSWVGFHNFLGDRPILWAPQKSASWSLPLPEPAYFWEDPDVVPNRYWSARQAYTEVDAALDAEEMQRDRETVSQENDTKRGRWEIAAQWWRHSVGLRYDDPATLPDELGKKMVAWRLHRALHFAEPFRGYGRKHPAISPALEELATLSQQDIRDRANNMPPENELAIPIEMLPADDSDFLRALSWFLALHVPAETSNEPWAMSNQQKVLAYRSLALPLSFRDIGDRLLPQVKADRAKQIYHEAIHHAWLIATKKKVAKTQDQIVLLRERNRAYRRNQEGIIL